MVGKKHVEKKNGNGHGPPSVEAWLIGAKAIATYIGFDHREIPNLVADEGLPAFQWRGRWRALPEEIRKWTHTIATRSRRQRTGGKSRHANRLYPPE